MLTTSNVLIGFISSVLILVLCAILIFLLIPGLINALRDYWEDKRKKKTKRYPVSGYVPNDIVAFGAADQMVGKPIKDKDGNVIGTIESVEPIYADDKLEYWIWHGYTIYDLDKVKLKKEK